MFSDEVCQTHPIGGGVTWLRDYKGGGIGFTALLVTVTRLRP